MSFLLKFKSVLHPILWSVPFARYTCNHFCIGILVVRLAGHMSQCVYNFINEYLSFFFPPFYRELNPMYEGYLQHDAQEVLQCILGNIQETCQRLKKEELKNMPVEESVPQLEEKSNQSIESNVTNSPGEDDDNMPSAHIAEEYEDKLLKGNGKRKSETEGGNAKKKSKVSKEQNAVEENQRQTRSKRKATGEKLEPQTDAIAKCCVENEIAKPTQKKSRVKINWLKSSGKQPSILSKFCALGKLTTNLASKDQMKETDVGGLKEASVRCENGNNIKEEYCEPLSLESAGQKGTEKAIKNEGL